MGVTLNDSNHYFGSHWGVFSCDVCNFMSSLPKIKNRVEVAWQSFIRKDNLLLTKVTLINHLFVASNSNAKRTINFISFFLR